MDIKSLFNETPEKMKEKVLLLYSEMPPDRFFDHMRNAQLFEQRLGRENEREEIICRLLASRMTADEIATILSYRIDIIRKIERDNSARKIPEYEKKLKERQRRKNRKPE